MSSILSLAPVLIILGITVIAVTVYFLIYRKKVNNALQKGKDAEAVGPEPSGIMRAGLILVLIGTMGITMTRISELKNSLDQAQSALQNQQMTLYSMQEDLQELESLLKKQSSRIEEWKIEYGELNPADHTAEIIVTVVPKDFTEGMKVHVSMDNEVTELEPSSASNVFTGKIRRNIFEISEPEIRISLSAGQEVHTETAEDEVLSALWLHYLPTVITSGGGETKQSKNSLKVDWMIQLDFVQKNDYSSFDKDSVRIITEINGEVTETADISKDITWEGNDGFFAEEWNKTYEVKEADTMRVYVEAVDSAGYTHQAELFGHSPHPEERDYQYTVLDGSTIVCRE